MIYDDLFAQGGLKNDKINIAAKRKCFFFAKVN